MSQKEKELDLLTSCKLTILQLLKYQELFLSLASISKV